MSQSIRKRRRDRHKNKFRLFSQTQDKIVFKLNISGIEAKLTFSTEKMVQELNKMMPVFVECAEKIRVGVAAFMNSGLSEWSLNPCVFNSGSPYLKCAVNPQSNCNDCSHYRKDIIS